MELKNIFDKYVLYKFPKTLNTSHINEENEKVNKETDCVKLEINSIKYIPSLNYTFSICMIRAMAYFILFKF